MTSLPFALPKDDPDIPDAYGMEFTYLNGKSESFEVVNHSIVDKVYERQPGSVKLIGAHPSPFWELQLRDDEMVCVPISAGSVRFDKRWYQLCECKAKMKTNKEQESES